MAEKEIDYIFTMDSIIPSNVRMRFNTINSISFQNNFKKCIYFYLLTR